nr:endonuclease domain-containing protein [Rhodopseudomonas palustris]
MQLRQLKSRGYHFRRQAPIGRYIVDFVCFGAKIVIEADGGQHGMPDGIAADQQRDAFLRGEGFRVLRFWNSDIDRHFDGVMQTVLDALPPPPVRPD